MLWALVAWRCTAVMAQATCDDIILEGVACLQMAASIPGLQTLTGSFQIHLHHQREPLVINTYFVNVHRINQWMQRKYLRFGFLTHSNLQTYRPARVYGVLQAVFGLET